MASMHQPDSPDNTMHAKNGTSLTRYSQQLNLCEHWITSLLVVWLLLETAVLAIQSFQWHMGEDVGFFYYLSWLVNEHQFIPYLDIHETSFPGSFILYALLGKLVGYSHQAFNLANVGSFVLCSALIFASLKKLHWRMAIASIALFGVFYFTLHRSMYLQRDYLAVIFIVAAIAVMASAQRLPIRAITTGMLFGIAASIKPHAAIGAPLVILLLAHTPTTTERRPLLQATLLSLAGFIALWLLIAGVLFYYGNLDAFVHMATDYLPLYQRMNGIHLPLTTAQRIQNGFDWASGTALTLGTPALLGVLFIWRNPACNKHQQKMALLLGLLWLAYLVYVGMGGKFWDYHMIPASVFFAASLGLLLVPYVANNWFMFALRVIYICVWLFYLWAMTQTAMFMQAAGCLLHMRDDCVLEEAGQYQAEDQLVLFLQKNLKPGERIEPYATSTLGPIFPALLRAQALPTTPYLEGFPLYHDPDVPYVNAIRQDMLERLKKNPPRFVIQPANFFAPGGSAASPFTALEVFYREHYQRVDANQYPELSDTVYYTVYERKNVYERKEPVQ